LYEHECFLEELRKSQRKLLKISRDKSFLLDRLLQYEKIDDSSSDSDATASSESDYEVQVKQEGASTPKRKRQEPPLNLPNFSEPAVLLGTTSGSSVASGQLTPNAQSSSSKLSEPARKRPKVVKKPKPATIAATLLQRSPQSQSVSTSVSEMKVPGQMTREELERHLEFKQSTKPQFMSIEKATHYLPDDIFSNENSNSGSERDIKEEIEDPDLIIDVP